MDIPGVSFFLENKMFPLPSGIQQPKMPVPYEIQGVPITGHKMDSPCFIEVKNSKYSNNLLPEKNQSFPFAKGEQLLAKRELYGHFSSFPAVSFSQLVGGFVGSKSQIRSVNREGCQIWDVIFRQFAETAYQPSNMQNNTQRYYNYGNVFSQNLFNSLCQESKSALDGITSYLISQNCEFLQEQEMIHSVSEFKSKENSIVKKVPSISDQKTVTMHGDKVEVPHPSGSVEHFARVGSVLNSDLPLMKFPKQSYAEVAKSVNCRAGYKNNGHQSYQLPILNKISSRLEKKNKNLDSKSKSLKTANSESVTPSIFKRSVPKYLKKIDKNQRRKEKIKVEKQSMMHSCGQISVCPDAVNEVKRVSLGIHSKELLASETSNWRERRESVNCNQQQPIQSVYRNPPLKRFSSVYPAFNRRNHALGTELNQVKASQCSSKYCQNRDMVNETEGKGSNKNYRIQDGKRIFEKKKFFQFGLHAENVNDCKNWRCKHVGVVCNSLNSGNLISSGKKNSVLVPESISLSCNSSVVSGDGEDSLGMESLLQSYVVEQKGSPDPNSEFLSSIECISVSSSCGEISDLSSSRKRIVSDCSVDSDDSFVVMFESEFVEDSGANEILQCDDSEDSDGWSDYEGDDASIGISDESEDQDEIDFCFLSPQLVIPAEGFNFIESLPSPMPDRLKSINERWRKEYELVPCEDKSPKKVHFPQCPKLATVHLLVKWDFAYRSARLGPWEEMARDRSRFQARVDRVGAVLAPILTPEHRHEIRQRMDMSAIK